MTQTFSPSDPPRPRRRPAPVRHVPLSAAELDRAHARRVERRLGQLLTEYIAAHDLAYGPASGGGEGRSDIAYSDPTYATVTRGTKPAGMSDGDRTAERDSDALSPLRKCLLDTERRIDEAERILHNAVVMLQKAMRTGPPMEQPPVDKTRGQVGHEEWLHTLAAKARRDQNGTP